jgi:hypothetical protein
MVVEDKTNLNAKNLLSGVTTEVTLGVIKTMVIMQ